MLVAVWPSPTFIPSRVFCPPLVKQILKKSKDDKLTVLEAMYQAGFNSKSSFNTAFKKETGQTPTQFRKMI